MPRPGGEPVTLDRSDNLHSALAKLEAADGGLPVVVLNPNCRIADSALTYRMIARASQRFGTSIAVVAPNPLWRQLARENGLRAYRSIGSLRRARGRSILSLPEGLVDSFISSLLPSLSGWGWAVALAFLLAVGIAAYFLVPVMTVTIQTPVEVLSRDVNVRVDVAVTTPDASAAVIPGRIIEHRFTVSDYVETTGDKKVGKEKAKGEVSILNNGPSLVMVPLGTVLSTASTERFGTAMAVTVPPFGQPGAATPGLAATVGPFGQPRGATPGPTIGPSVAASAAIVRVPVVAADPGEKGNVPPLAISKIEGDAFRGLTVFNERGLSGGTDENTRSASADDRSRLKEVLFQRAQSQSLSELTVRVRQSESLIPHSMQVRIEGEEYDKAVDEEGDRLRGMVYVVATGIAFGNQDLNSLAEREWKASMSKGFRSLPGNLNLTPPEVVQAGARTANLKVAATGRVERILEVDGMTRELQGMTVREARSKLGYLGSPLKVVDVEIWPDWSLRAYRIEVRTVQ